MILVYYIDKPDDHPLHVIACKLGFVRSGWVRPRDLMDRRTGELDRGRIMSMFTALDETLPPGIPLIVNTERWLWIIRKDSGLVPSYDWLSRNYALIAYLRQRFLNRLIGTWGLRKGSNDDLNDLYDEWSCGVLSVYRRDGEASQGWAVRVMERYRQTELVGKPIHLDLAPVMWQKRGASRDDARAATDRELEQMVKVVKTLDPRWAGLWLRDGIQGVTDEYIEKAFGVMAKELT